MMPPAKKTAAKKAAKPAPITAIEKFEAEFAKSFGGTLEHEHTVSPYAVIPTGSINLDYATIVGGYPAGRIIEIYGEEHVGKTTLMTLGFIEAQRAHPDKMVALVDMEGTYDLGYAQRLGLDLKRFWKPDAPASAEEAADMYRKFVRSGICSMVGLDSIGALIGEAEMDKDSRDATVAIVARIMSRTVREMSAIGGRNGTVMIVLNQTRASLEKYGSPTTTSGGKVVKFMTTMRIYLRRGDREKTKTVKVEGVDIPVGYEVVAKIEKNKCAPFGKVGVFILFNQATDKYGPIGIDKIDEAATIGILRGVIERRGAYYRFPGEEDMVQGREAVIERMKADPSLVAKIRQAALDSIADQIHDEDYVPEEDVVQDDLDLSGVL